MVSVLMLLVAVLPNLYLSLHLDGWLGDCSRFALALVIIAGLREISILLMWRTLMRRLNLGEEYSVGAVSRAY